MSDNFEKNIDRMLSLIPEGRANPISRKALARRLDIPERELDRLVSTAIRVYGIPIGAKRSKPSGLYLISNESERMQAIRPLNAQAREITSHALRLEKIELEGWRERVEELRKRGA